MTKKSKASPPGSTDSGISLNTFLLLADRMPRDTELMLKRLHATHRKTQAQWNALVTEYGGLK